MTTEESRLWDQICAALARQFDDEELVRSLSLGRIVTLTPEAVTVEFPSKLHVLLIETLFLEDLLDILALNQGRKPQVQLMARQGGNKEICGDSSVEPETPELSWDFGKAGRELNDPSKLLRESFQNLVQETTAQVPRMQHPPFADLLAFVHEGLEEQLREPLRVHLNVCLICENQVEALRAGKQAAEQVEE